MDELIESAIMFLLKFAPFPSMDSISQLFSRISDRSSVKSLVQYARFKINLLMLN